MGVLKEAKGERVEGDVGARWAKLRIGRRGVEEGSVIVMKFLERKEVISDWGSAVRAGSSEYLDWGSDFRVEGVGFFSGLAFFPSLRVACCDGSNAALFSSFAALLTAFERAFSAFRASLLTKLSLSLVFGISANFLNFFSCFRSSLESPFFPRPFSGLLSGALTLRFFESDPLTLISSDSSCCRFAML